LQAGYPAILEPIEVNKLWKQIGNPGPGHYQPAENLNTFKTASVPVKKQFFGSSSVRFNDERSVVGHKNPNVGPGCYPISEEVELN